MPKQTTTDGQSDPRKSAGRRASALVGFVASAGVVVVVFAAAYGLSGMQVRPAVVDAVASSDGFADESRCIDCHEQAVDFFETGHAKTLTPATADSSLRLLQTLANSNIGKTENVSVSQVDGGVRLTVADADPATSTGVDWCVGSGAHARTWVSTGPDSFGTTDLLELRWTWYHQTDSFDVTPGHPEKQGLSATGRLGLMFDGPRAVRCFACHATHVPVDDGRIDQARIHPGVTCQRCHGARQKHVESEGAFRLPEWKAADRNDAVSRCAQCHRSVEEQPVEDVRIDNPDIVRFQPVGLSQSKCFTESEMTCTTCHDPHKPLAKQDSLGVWQCSQCHDAKHNQVTCAAGQVGDCLKCHMPKVQSDSPIDFTDHWIRVRTATDVEQ